LKEAANYAKHGVCLSAAARFEWAEALVWEDLRRHYGEFRYVAIGYIGLRLYVIVFVDRADQRRIISLRKANSREVQLYAQA
jgi:uncharacterized DUF497 family protein